MQEHEDHCDPDGAPLGRCTRRPCGPATPPTNASREKCAKFRRWRNRELKGRARTKRPCEGWGVGRPAYPPTSLSPTASAGEEGREERSAHVWHGGAHAVGRV